MNHDYEILNGKPHLGLYFATAYVVKDVDWTEDFKDSSKFNELKRESENTFSGIESSNPGLQIRKSQWIIRQPRFGGVLSINGTVGLKFMVWGRAYKVHRLNKKGSRRYEKKWINGRRKRLRVDRH